jgi:hypothetical protein
MKRERDRLAKALYDHPFANSLATPERQGVSKRRLRLLDSNRDLGRAFDRWMRYFEFDPKAAEFFFNLDPDSLTKPH